MPNSRFAQFDVYWWVAASGPELCRYATRRPEDIECFSPTHYRIKAHALDGSGDILEIILIEQDGTWNVNVATMFAPSGTAIVSPACAARESPDAVTRNSTSDAGPPPN